MPSLAVDIAFSYSQAPLPELPDEIPKMTYQEFSIPDTSPVFRYSADAFGVNHWTSGFVDRGDGYDRTLHCSNHSDAAITFNISATSLTLDIPLSSYCTSTVSFNGSSPEPACATETNPYQKIGLPLGVHTVTYRKQNEMDTTQFLGISGERWTPTGLVNATVDDAQKEYLNQLSSTASDRDAVPTISFGPSDSAWNTISSSSNGQTITTGSDQAASSDEMSSINQGSFYNKSVSFTEQAGASFSVAFRGQAVYMYGTTGPESGTANINLNGQTVMSKLNLTAPWRNFYQMIYMNDQLDPTQRTNLSIINGPEGKRLVVDFVVVQVSQQDSLVFPGANTTSPNPSSPAGVKSTSFLATTAGKAVVIAVPATCAVLFICSLLLYWLKRGRNRKNNKSNGNHISPPFYAGSDGSYYEDETSKAFASPVPMQFPGQGKSPRSGQTLRPWDDRQLTRARSATSSHDALHDGSTITASRDDLMRLMADVMTFQQGRPQYSEQRVPVSTGEGAPTYLMRDEYAALGPPVRNGAVEEVGPGIASPYSGLGSTAPSLSSILATPPSAFASQRSMQTQQPFTGSSGVPRSAPVLPMSVVGTSVVSGRFTDFEAETDIWPSDSVSAIGTVEPEHPSRRKQRQSMPVSAVTTSSTRRGEMIPSVPSLPALPNESRFSASELQLFPMPPLSSPAVMK